MPATSMGSAVASGVLLTSGSFREYVVPGLPVISNIISGPGGRLWFTLEGGAAYIGAITTAGVVSLYPLGVADNYGGLCTGPDGLIWFTEFNSQKVSKIASDGSGYTSYALASGPGGIVPGPDGNLWVFRPAADAVDRVTTTGTITTFTFTAGTFPHGPCVGTDANIWVCGQSNGKIVKLTTTGVSTQYGPVPAGAGSKPYVIAPGNDGALWFTEFDPTGNNVGRVTYAGSITNEYALTTPSSTPGGLCPGPSTDVWFTEKTNNKIGKITSAGAITEYTIPTAASNPDKIVAGPDGNLWFTEHDVGRIGKIAP